MTIKTIPENNSGALAPLIYEISGADTENIVTVEITDERGTKTIGEKKLHGETSYTVNAANYMARQITVKPVSDKWRGFGKAGERSTVSRIRIDNELSPATQITGGTEICKECRLLSNASGIPKLAPGEKDEMAFIAPGKTITAQALLSGNNIGKKIDLGTIQCEEGVYVLIVDSDNMRQEGLDGFTYMEITISDNNTIIARRKYEIAHVSPKAVRLCWQNPYGQIDYHTFTMIEKRIEADKTKTYLADGYNTAGISLETTYYITSDCEPRETIQWLAEILKSPKVWMAGNGGFIRMDVLTDNAVVAGDAPGAISLAIRQAERENIKTA